MIGAGGTRAKTDLSTIKRGPIIAALIIGAFVAILNETLIGIAFPDLMKQFGVETSTIQWLSTVYMLVIGILVPVTALLQHCARAHYYNHFALVNDRGRPGYKQWDIDNAACFSDDRYFHDHDAVADDRPKSAASKAISAWDGHHEYAAAGFRCNWNGLVH
ncbi:hypothetical protein EBB07_22705 [Paenibacillaceae bacterium]|nr:hypothetical protein EBB07_22705 [Paenibacillaceae bacterium]